MKSEFELSNQVKDLKIPYPHKLLLSVELEEHMLYRSQSEDMGGFSGEETSELYEIHNNFIFKFLDRLSPKSRRFFEITILGLPVVGFLIYLIKEDFMIQFIREGGAVMLPILLLGFALSVRELHFFFRTVVVKDHSISSLNIDTSSVLVGGLALLVLGIGATALGIYVSANGVVSGNLPVAIFLTGLKESMGPMIVSSTLSALVLIVHFSTRRMLVAWKAPIRS